jgi:hypothetical protein
MVYLLDKSASSKLLNFTEGSFFTAVSASSAAALQQSYNK